jgi:hypothetical protein
VGSISQFNSQGSFSVPGNYTLPGEGGSQIGKLTATVAIPEPIKLLGPANNATLTRSNGMTISWSGGGVNEFLQIEVNSLEIVLTMSAPPQYALSLPILALSRSHLSARSPSCYAKRDIIRLGSFLTNVQLFHGERLVGWNPLGPYQRSGLRLWLGFRILDAEMTLGCSLRSEPILENRRVKRGWLVALKGIEPLFKP